MFALAEQVGSKPQPKGKPVYNVLACAGQIRPSPAEPETFALPAKPTRIVHY